VLSGTAEYRFDSSPGRETVITTEEGEERVYWEDDPLTGVSWLVTARVASERPRDFDFRRARGILDVRWTLVSPGGEALRTGRDVFAASRAAGGYADLRGKAGSAQAAAASAGAPPPGEDLRQALLEDLAAQAASELALLAGPRFTEADLAPAPDPDGRRARALAAAGDWDAAAAIWQDLLTRNPAYGPALYNLGLYREITGDLPEAWRCFRLAFQSRQLPQYRAALSRVSGVLRRTGQLPRPDGDGK
jgi:tetratricopeptide (TPR) repeat protein